MFQNIPPKSFNQSKSQNDPQITQITQKEWVSMPLYQERGKKVLITGANGFIGTALCSRLASGNKVIGVDITGHADRALNNDGFRVIWIKNFGLGRKEGW